MKYLEITKDLLEILVLVLTAWQLTKNNKDNYKSLVLKRTT